MNTPRSWPRGSIKPSSRKCWGWLKTKIGRNVLWHRPAHGQSGKFYGTWAKLLSKMTHSWGKKRVEMHLTWNLMYALMSKLGFKSGVGEMRGVFIITFYEIMRSGFLQKALGTVWRQGVWRSERPTVERETPLRVFWERIKDAERFLNQEIFLNKTKTGD